MRISVPTFVHETIHGLKNILMQEYYKQVMIIDDDPIDRYILRRNIKKTNFASEIIESRTGLDALNILTDYSLSRREIPELIFLDINMPVLDGFEFLDAIKLIKEYKNSCRIVVVSSYQNELDKKKVLLYESVIGYFEKPVQEETLLELIEQLRLNQAS
jgi:CheY-like chemotaxis protein